MMLKGRTIIVNILTRMALILDTQYDTMTIYPSKEAVRQHVHKTLY